MAWTKILLSGAVVNADINASAAIATSKLSGEITSITGHGTGTAALVNTGLTVGLIPTIGTGGLEADDILIINGAGTEMVGLQAASGFNLALGTGAGTVSEGDHTHSGVYAPVAHTLDSHSDMATGKVSGDIVYYNGGTWQPATPAEAGVATASHNHTGTYALIGGASGQNFATNDLTVAGNLLITGELQQASITELLVEDIKMTLGNGAHNTSATDGAGVIIDNDATDADRTSLYFVDGTGWNFKHGEDAVTGNPALKLMGATTSAGAASHTAALGMMHYNTSDSSWYIYT